MFPFRPLGKKPPALTPAPGVVPVPLENVPYTMCSTWLVVRAYAIAFEFAGTTVVAPTVVIVAGVDWNPPSGVSVGDDPLSACRNAPMRFAYSGY